MSDTTKQLLASAKQFYDKVGSVYCKPLKSPIIFSKHGWNHIKYKKSGHRRDDSDMRMRLHLIRFAPDVIRQAISANQSIEEKMIGGKLVPVTFTEIHGIVDGLRRYLVVVIRKFPDGSSHYYSIRNHHKRPKKPFRAS